MSSPCGPAVRAQTGDLDNRHFRSEACTARRRGERLADRGARRLANRATAVADQECDQRACAVIVDAGEICVAARDAVDEPKGDQEFERPIDGNGRGTRTTDGVHNVVGTQWFVARGQRLQHLAADRREPLRARRANLLGVGDRFGGATGVVVTRIEKHAGHGRNLEHVPQKVGTGFAKRTCSNKMIGLAAVSSAAGSWFRNMSVLKTRCTAAKPEAWSGRKTPRPDVGPNSGSKSCSKEKPRSSPAQPPASASASPASSRRTAPMW